MEESNYSIFKIDDVIVNDLGEMWGKIVGVPEEEE